MPHLNGGLHYFFFPNYLRHLEWRSDSEKKAQKPLGATLNSDYRSIDLIKMLEVMVPAPTQLVDFHLQYPASVFYCINSHHRATGLSDSLLEPVGCGMG